MKEKSPYPSSKTYEEENYIGETKRNVITRWNEHENINKNSEPVKRLFQQPDDVFHGKF